MSETHSRQTRYAKFNIACPRVKRNTEGGRIFPVIACQEWNKLPLQMRKAETFFLINVVPLAYNYFIVL